MSELNQRHSLESLARRLAERCWVTGEFTLRSGARADAYFDKFL